MPEDWEIVYYQAPQSSSSPAHDFIKGLDPKAKAKVINAIDLLQTYGIKLGLPRVKKLTGTELWELRILGQDSIRILYVAFTGKKFLLLHGFAKKKQKTDKREIDIAEARLREYRLRKA